jgi:hypothetical protein
VNDDTVIFATTPAKLRERIAATELQLRLLRRTLKLLEQTTGVRPIDNVKRKAKAKGVLPPVAPPADA